MSNASNQLVMGVDPSGVRTSISHQESDANEDILRIEETRKVADDSSAVLPELIQQVDSISRKIADGEKVSKLTIDGAKILGGYASEKFGILTPAVISGISTEKLFTYAELNGVARVTTEDLKTLVSVGVEKILIFIENMLRYITKMGHTFKTSFKAVQFAGVYHSLSHGHYDSALSTISNAENLDMSKWNSELNPLFAFMGTKGAIDKSTFLDGVKAVVELYISKNVSNLLLDTLKVIAETITHVDTTSDPKTMLVTIRNKVSEVLKNKVSGNELTLSIKNISTNFNKEGQDYINTNHCYIVGINGLHVHVLSTPKELQENSKPLVFHTLTLEAQIDKQAIPFLNAEEVGKDMLNPVNNIFNGINNESLLASEKTIHDLLSKCRVIYASNKNGHTTQETSRAMVSASIIDILKVITEALQKHMLTKYTYPFDMCIQYLKVAYAVSKGNTTHEDFMDLIPIHLTEYVTQEGIGSTIKDALDRIIAWIKEQFAKLKDFLTKSGGHIQEIKVEEIKKDINLTQDKLTKLKDGASVSVSKPIVIDLTMHPGFLHMLGIAARHASKHSIPSTDEHNVIDFCNVYAGKLAKLMECNMGSQLIRVIEKVTNDDAAEAYNEYGIKSLGASIIKMFDGLDVYAGSPNFIYDINAYTAGVNDKMYLRVYNNSSYAVRYERNNGMRCYKDLSNTNLTITDPVGFCTKLLLTAEKFLTLPKAHDIVTKSNNELNKILEVIMADINNERNSSTPDIAIINRNKLIYKAVRDVYTYGYMLSAADGMHTLAKEINDVVQSVMHEYATA